MSETSFDFTEGGLHFVAQKVESPKGMDEVTISKDGKVLRRFLWPSYKIWNIPAHAQDIIEDLDEGLSEAGSTGFGGNVYK